MVLTDYLLSERDVTWDIAKQAGVNYGVIRLPENGTFDITDFSHWVGIYKKFTDFGIKPVVVEPMPNSIHNHIKIGDDKRDECIEKTIKMFENMDRLDIRILCFNFMAHIGWIRTNDKYVERGGAFVTEFEMDKFTKETPIITEKQLWENYNIFIKAVIPYAESYNIKLALHPDDPPVKLGKTSRIMTSLVNINRALDIVKSQNLGLTFCQATFKLMGEDIYKIVPGLKDKIFFIHFRNVAGNKYKFRETFHDNGDINMAKMIKVFKDSKINVPIRVDHVPTYIGENPEIAGYGAIGRLFAIGYLKGLLEEYECFH